jgi:long-chain acyl-CoA synthetase
MRARLLVNPLGKNRRIHTPERDGKQIRSAFDRSGTFAPQGAVCLIGEPISAMESTLVKYIESFYRRGDEIAYVHSRGYRTIRWSYRAVATGARRFARELESRGVNKGDRVLLWGGNCAEWVVSFLGCVLRGAVVVPMDRVAAPDFALRVHRQVEARLCVCSQELADRLGDVPLFKLEELAETMVQDGPEQHCPDNLKRDDTVEIVFTSGTTAEPKGVVISHKNILANLEPFETEISRYIKYERPFHPLRFLNLLPLSHVFGQFLGIFIPQLLGATVIFQDSLNPTEVVRTIKREKASVLVAVPRMLESLREKITRDQQGANEHARFQRDFREAEGQHFLRRWWRFRKIRREFGWKFWALISGGAALDAETEQFWGRLGFAVIQGYGLTETTSLVSVNHPFRLGKGSIGKVLPGREIRLAEDGEILVRGENIASSYLQEKEAKPVVGDEGWFHTGDMGEMDAAGNLYFKGRRKNVIVTPEGMNIFPEDLEAALRRQPEVRDCVVVGLAVGGNAEPCAVLILKEAGIEAEPIVKRANLALAEHQHMRHWAVWPDDDFPRTSTQKPRLNLIGEFVQSTIKGRRPAPPAGDALADLIGRVTGRAGFRRSPDASLSADLHLSSIERVELLGALEDRFQIDLNESTFTAATTIGDLERMLRQPAARRSEYPYPRWATSWPVSIVRFAVYYLLSWPAAMVMARPDIRGREHFRGLKGPILIVSNHITQVDLGFILPALPFRFRHRLKVAMLGEMLRDMRNPPVELGFFRRCVEELSYFLVVGLFNVFPLPQQTGFRESFAFAGESADRGYSILVFPEGQRTQEGRLSPFRSGIGMLAKNLDIPVMPIRIDGLFELKRRGKKLAPPGTIKVTIGSAIRFGQDLKPESIAAELERCISDLERK